MRACCDVAAMSDESSVSRLDGTLLPGYGGHLRSIMPEGKKGRGDAGSLGDATVAKFTAAIPRYAHTPLLRLTAA